jgi:hypothetical protein
MQKATNPFNVSFGKPPLHIIARHNEFSTIVDTFNDENPETNAFVLTGPRGSGKTVTLTAVKHYYDQLDGWLCVDLLPDGNLLQSLAATLYSVGNMRKLFLKAEFSFSFQGLGLTIGHGEPVTDVLSFLACELAYLKKKGIRLLVTIDEVTSSQEMRTFAHAFQHFLREDYDLFLLMTGLHQNVSALQTEKTLTFLYRAPKINLGPLSLPAIAIAYQEIFSTTKEKGIELAKFTRGYAFAFQMLGSLLFKRGSLELNASVLSEFDEIMFARSYSTIWAELSPKERIFLKGIQEHRATTNKEVTDLGILGEKELPVYKNRLVAKGILETPERGTFRFSLPRFDVFVQQVIDFE